jgi:hypothetical protein
MKWGGMGGGAVACERLDCFDFVCFCFEGLLRADRVEAFFFFGTGGLLSGRHDGGAMTARTASSW